jgi:hypothetical protein
MFLLKAYEFYHIEDLQRNKPSFLQRAFKGYFCFLFIFLWKLHAILEAFWTSFSISNSLSLQVVPVISSRPKTTS